MLPSTFLLPLQIRVNITPIPFMRFCLNWEKCALLRPNKTRLFRLKSLPLGKTLVPIEEPELSSETNFCSIIVFLHYNATMFLSSPRSLNLLTILSKEICLALPQENEPKRWMNPALVRKQPYRYILSPMLNHPDMDKDLHLNSHNFVANWWTNCLYYSLLITLFRKGQLDYPIFNSIGSILCDVRY